MRSQGGARSSLALGWLAAGRWPEEAQPQRVFAGAFEVRVDGVRKDHLLLLRHAPAEINANLPVARRLHPHHHARSDPRILKPTGILQSPDNSGLNLPNCVVGEF